ncbi:hypothetical protein [Microtetraspora malaysiensis]|uniref:hypothetical protein n=1 Tax=Microtetraspora malaysiensis TaxID=161358 RepID=UPI00082AC39B|nr:hypothetical protein [Microtetraspora malaysiensis]
MNGSQDAAVLRLRPVVRASRLPDGIHLRAWSTSVSLEGVAGLWPLWERLHPLLAAGVTEAGLDALCPDPGTRRAVGVLLDRLHENDLLVRVRPDAPTPPAVRSWLESAAPDPDAVWATLRDLRVTVYGEGPIADAALAALTRCHLTTHRIASADVPAGHLRVRAAGLAVHAGHLSGAGFVTYAVNADEVGGPAAVLAARLGRLPARSWTPAAAEMLAAAAVDRLLRACAGLPGRAGEILLVRPGPLTATYRPWPPADPAPRARRLTLEEALRRTELVTDPELGLLPEARVDGLAQLPVGMAVCAVPGTPVAGIGPTTETARLEAVRAAAQVSLGLDPAVAAVGADELHARGILLRHRADRAAWHVRPGECVTHDPIATHWWRTLAERLREPVRVQVRDLGGAWHAEIHDTGGDRLSWAVELECDSAVAMAALAAAGTSYAGPSMRAVAVCGALPPPDITEEEMDEDLGRWLWPAPISRDEEALQDVLSRLTGCRPRLDNSGSELAAAGFQIWRGEG